MDEILISDATAFYLTDYLAIFVHVRLCSAFVTRTFIVTSCHVTSVFMVDSYNLAVSTT